MPKHRARYKLPVIWLQCLCYVWPIIVGVRCGKCGRCGIVPSERVDEPEKGKAGPL